MTWSDAAAGEFVRDEMKRQGVSVAALAAELGKSVNTVRRRLAGKGVWKIGEVMCVARVLGLSGAELLNRVDTAASA